jgi:hypothetical protein
MYVYIYVYSGVSCDTMVFERDPECTSCQDTKEKLVSVPSTLKVAEFVDQFILASGAIDLSTVSGGVDLKPPTEPVVYDSSDMCFYCVTGPLAALKGIHIWCFFLK